MMNAIYWAQWIGKPRKHSVISIIKGVFTMSTTYSGSKISISADLPAGFGAGPLTEASFAGVNFVTGACALKEVPKLGRTWDKVANELVCQNSSFDSKGGAKWDTLTYKLNRIPTDAAQAIYEALEASGSDSGSFKVELPDGAGTFFLVAQVSMFALADGGNKNTIHTSSVELLLQADPVPVYS